MKRISTVAFWVFITSILFVGFTNNLEAKEGFYIGLGYASLAASDILTDYSDLVLVDVASLQFAELGQLEDGEGISFLVGFGVNEFMSLDYYSVHTRHKVEFQSGTYRQTYGATVNASNIGIRLNGKAGEKGELFIRFGLIGSATVTYEDNVYGPPSYLTPSGDTELSGDSNSIGIGFSYIPEGFGFQISTTRFNATLSKASLAGVSFSVPDEDVTFKVVDLALIIQF